MRAAVGKWGKWGAVCSVWFVALLPVSRGGMGLAGVGALK